MSTIFTKIIAKEIPADIVYEDDRVIAFLDIRPIRKGHTLVVPKKEFENIFDGDAETLSYMMTIVQKVAQALMTTVGAKGVNVHMNNGHEAGQDVPHAHMHVIPRFARGEAFVVTNHEVYEGSESVDLAEKIRAVVAS